MKGGCIIIMENIKKGLPGLILVSLLVVLGSWITSVLQEYIKIEALTIVILLGILVNNNFNIGEKYQAGIKFSLKKLLNLGIIFLGFKLNLTLLAELGGSMLSIIIFYIPFVLMLSVLLGKFFKIEPKTALLIGVGSSICGASAIIALSPCIKAKEEDSIIAVSVISFLGAIGVIIYSLIANTSFFTSTLNFGIWSGLSLQGVSHAIAAAFAMGEEAGKIGTIVKLTRVIMILPVSIGLSYYYQKLMAAKEKTEGCSEITKSKVPNYILYFLIVVVINSLDFLPQFVSESFSSLSNIFMMMAMTSMGLSIKFKDIIKKGVTAFQMGLVLFSLISMTCLTIVKFVV